MGTRGLAYYLQLDCPRCGEEVYSGVGLTLLKHLGRPVIPADDGAQMQVECPACSAVVYTGDLEVFAEDGSE